MCCQDSGNGDTGILQCEPLLTSKRATFYQSFYRAKRDARRLRRVELDALQTNLKQLTQLDDDTTIATCMRQCLILSYGPQNYGATLNDLCDILLSSSSSSSSNDNLLRFMHLFGGSDKDQLDERTWLLALFTTKVILAAVTR